MTRNKVETVAVDSGLDDWLLIDELQRRDTEGWELVDVDEPVPHSRYSLTFRRAVYGADRPDVPSWLW